MATLKSITRGEKILRKTTYSILAKQRNKIYLILILISALASILVFASCASDKDSHHNHNHSTVFEKAKVDSVKLNLALNYVKKHFGPDLLHETVVIRKGELLFSGDSTNKKHNIYSCTKSFTSTILGLLIDEGKCSLDDFAFQYDSKLKEKYPEIKLRHFASMTSGYNAVGTSRWCDECSEDWSLTPYKPADPLFAPGTKYCYWDEAQMYFGKVLTIIANEDLYEYFDRKVMSKIGITDWKWWYEETWNGIPLRNGCTGIEISAEEMARFSLLILNNGNWNGNQIIPADWILKASSVQVPLSVPTADTDRKSTDGSGKYGFNWWLKGEAGDMENLPDGTFFMSGLNNNVSFIVPEWNLVFIRMGDDFNPKAGKRVVYNQFFGELREAIK